jgi:prophage regulatory protein
MTKILRLPSVMSYTGLSRSSIYLQMKNGSFPKSISLGVRTAGWIESEVLAWIDSKIHNARS